MKAIFSSKGGEFNGIMALYAGLNGKKEKQKSRSYLSVPENGTADITLQFKPEEAGTYDVWLCTDDGTTEYAHSTVEITSEGLMSNLSITNVKIQNTLDNTICSNQLKGYAVIKNQLNTRFSGGVNVKLWEQGEGSSFYWNIASSISQMEIPASGSSTLNFHFKNLRIGRQYCIEMTYVDQNGNLSNGSLWKYMYRLEPAIVFWKNSGEMNLVSDKSSYNLPVGTSGLYSYGTSLTQLTANNSNPNIIYAFEKMTALPKINTTLSHVNIVYENEADSILLQTGYPYYNEKSFHAGYARLSHTFSADISGKGWESILLPFVPETIRIDTTTYQLGDEANPFWIYEFTKVDNSNTPVFEQSTRLFADMPYLIACDPSLAGKTITFEACDVRFSANGEANRVVSGDIFKMYANTVQKSLKNVYTMNADGTAFNFSSLSKSVTPMTAYFETTLAQNERPKSIVLPEVPKLTAVSQVKTDMAQSRYPIYTTAGQIVGYTPTATGINMPNLKPGIYIVNGRKVMVK